MDLKRTIYLAARDNKLDILKVALFLKSEAEISKLISARQYGTTPLMKACYKGHIEIVKYLIQKCHADVERVGDIMFHRKKKIEGASPLWCAAAKGHLDIVKIILNHDGNVNCTTNSKSTPLRAACFVGYLEIVKCLIENGADINSVNNLDQTCLMAACSQGHHLIVKYLVKCKATIDILDTSKNSALKMCVSLGMLETVKFLVENGANIDIIDCQGQTCLMAACDRKHYEIAKYLIKCGANVNKLDVNENSALKICVTQGNLEMTKYLIKCVANVKNAGCYKACSMLIYPCSDGVSTSLSTACRTGNIEMVHYLIQKCHADVEETTTIIVDESPINNVSPLWCAATAGHLSVVKVLVEQYNASVNSATHRPTLYGTCYAGHLKVIKYLIDNGAQPDVLNDAGMSCLMAACYNKKNDVVKYLIENNRVNVNKIDKFGNSAVLSIVESGNSDIVKHLVELGADIEVSNCDGMTCLILACQNNHTEIAKYLIESMANVNRKMLNGDTALHKCIKSNNFELVKLLLKKGAKLFTNSGGITPLLYAALEGNVSIMHYFIKNCKLSKEEKIDAFEILGAVFADNVRNMHTAHKYWKEGMILRYEDKKYPINKLHINSPLSSYLDTTEVNNYDQLMNLNIEDFIEMKKQALLIRERILGETHPLTVWYIKKMGSHFQSSDFENCLQLWTYSLDVGQLSEIPLSSIIYEDLKIFTQHYFLNVHDLYTVIQRQEIDVLFKRILWLSKKTIKEIERALKAYKQEELDESITFSDTIKLALYHVYLLSKLLPHLNQSQTFEVKKTVWQLVNLKPKLKNCYTLLHLASVKHVTISDDTLKLDFFPNIQVMELLLKAGAHPNDIDSNHNTPLHLITMDSDLHIGIFQLLLNQGAHLDVRNLENLTPFDLVREMHLIEFYPLKYINLQCLCAHAIDFYDIGYEDKVPKNVRNFLYLHRSH